MKLRNIAIIAHVDHGKTTLVDGLLKQSKTFRENEALMSQKLIMDSNAQERERGITILAKNTAITYNGYKLNIIDTPGHADFSGEVERTLNMADGALLLVDAQEGPMPQTKFVLRKALELGLKIIVVINKIDKKDARVEQVIHEISDLFLEVATVDSHLDFPVLYAIGRDGKSWNEMPSDFSGPADLAPILEAIIKYIPSPDVNDQKPFQMMISSLDWDSYKGKYAIGRIKSGSLKDGDELLLMKHTGGQEKVTVGKIFINQGLKRVEVESVDMGEIIAITGIENAEIGDTLTHPTNPEALPAIKISEPTLSVSISPNTSPFKGQDGEFLTSRQIMKRIEKELQTNVAMRFKIDESGQYVLSGRGELHLCVFLETLSREGYEIEIGKPKVITKEIDGVLCEPIEEFFVDVPTEFVGNIITEFGKRGGILKYHEELSPNNSRITFEIATKDTLGLRSVLLTLSKGLAIVSSAFLKYEPMKNDVKKFRKGVLVASETGKATAYGLNNAQERGILFITPGMPVYMGMIVGLTPRDGDLRVNVCKAKHLTNMRSKGEDGIILDSPLLMTLEESFGFIEDDELLEITPKNIRLRKIKLETK